jgi:hypothetical protein
MQDTTIRCLILVGVLALGQWLVQAGAARPVGQHPRWPTEEAVFAVDGWTADPPTIEEAWGVAHVVRAYARPDGTTATLVISASVEAKRLYRTEPTTAFSGAGYEVGAPPPGLVAPAAGREALLLRRGDERWLLLSAFGERRGLLGNGAAGWGAAVLDGVRGRANDYFLVRVLAPLDGAAMPARDGAVALADALFPRLAAWYAAQPEP